jgi:predicted unusual protein kinase regulating ubiquinone biosynthesis (AarF/ABC1/UbiB family)
MRGLLVGVSLINQWLGPLLGHIDLGLSEDLRTAFDALHAQAQPLTLEALREILEADLGPAARELLDGLEPTPTTAGPIGQVHRATLPDGTPVAVKVRYPGISDTIDRDLAPATLSARLASWFPGSAQLDALAGPLHDRVLAECDFARAAERQDRFWWLFAVHPTVVVPSVHRAHSSPNVLTTTTVTGASLDAYLRSNPDQVSRDRAGEALFDFFMGALFQHGLYKCDPDPANYLFLPDGRLALVDFGCVRELDPAFVAKLAALTHSLWADERELFVRALADLDIVPKGEADGSDSARSLLRAAFGPLSRDEVSTFDTNGESTLAEALRRWRDAQGPILSGELFFVLRMASGLSRVLGQLGARANWHQRLQALLQTYPKPSFDVVLLDPGVSPIVMVRELREATGLPLREIEYIMKMIPQTIKQAIPRADAEALRVKLESAGARVEIKLARMSP